MQSLPNAKDTTAFVALFETVRRSRKAKGARHFARARSHRGHRRDR